MDIRKVVYKNSVKRIFHNGQDQKIGKIYQEQLKHDQFVFHVVSKRKLPIEE
jgi:hypothetical protein